VPFHELTINFAKLKEADELDSWPEVIKDFCSSNKFDANYEWIFSQMLAKIAEVPLVKNENGLYSGKQLFIDIRKSPTLSGILLLCKFPSRSVLVPKQTSVEGRPYCALVPLIMSAYKRYKDYPYCAWDREEIGNITETKLKDAMLLTELPQLTKEEVLIARQIALTPQSGVKAGIPRNPASTYVLYLKKESGISSLPDLAKIMICQTWCAHPINRNSYMILNPLDWDNLPEELISSSGLEDIPVAPKVKKPSYSETDW
jgi:hypothetical protein